MTDDEKNAVIVLCGMVVLGMIIWFVGSTITN